MSENIPILEVLKHYPGTMKKMYSFTCFKCLLSNFSFSDTKQQAIDSAEVGGWKIIDGNWYCKECSR